MDPSSKDVVIPAPVMALKEHLGPGGLMIYACLTETCNEAGQTSVDYNTLIRMSGMSRAVVAKAIQMLTSHRLILQQRRFSQSTIYTLVHYINYCSSENELLASSSLTNELLTTTTLNTIESIRVEDKSSENELMNYSSSENELMGERKPHSSFRESDANALICTLTGWGAVPGSTDERPHYLGIVMDLHDRHNSNTLGYLRPFWEAFKRRYPRSTKMFWLTEWAVQGVIPDDMRAPGYKAKANSNGHKPSGPEKPSDMAQYTWECLEYLRMNPKGTNRRTALEEVHKRGLMLEVIE